MFGFRGLVTFLIAGYLLLGFEGYAAQGGDSESDPSSNETSYRTTYRSGIEKYYQGLLDSVSSTRPPSSSESPESDADSSGPLSGIISGAENVTKRAFGDFLNLFEKHFHAIFPGTLWCGAGNISRNGNLGTFNDTDACCRAHDKCPADLAPGQTEGDIINNGAFTRSACSCDNQLYHCLKNAHSIIADEIGLTYFDILGPQCFEYNYPTTSCAEYGKRTLFKTPCEKYNYNTTQPKRLIWVDNPAY